MLRAAVHRHTWPPTPPHRDARKARNRLGRLLFGSCLAFSTVHRLRGDGVQLPRSPARNGQCLRACEDKCSARYSLIDDASPAREPSPTPSVVVRPFIRRSAILPCPPVVTTTQKNPSFFLFFFSFTSSYTCIDKGICEADDYRRLSGKKRTKNNPSKVK